MKDLAARLLSGYGIVATLFGADPDLPQPEKATIRNPVILVHGFADSAASMRIMKTRLTRAGWNVHTVNLIPNDGSASLEELARQLAAYIAQTFPNHITIDLVGFSMGGIVCRCYAQKLDRFGRVDRLITISSPNNGTWSAYLSNKPGCVEMRPGSALLTSLNSDLPSLKRIQFMSIWTPLDLVIVPASSSRLSIGQQTKVWAAAHPLMILQRRSLDAVELSLSATPETKFKNFSNATSSK